MFEPVTAKVPPATFFTQSIEDCVIYLANVHDRAHYEWPVVVVEAFDSTITQSLGTQLYHGSAFTEKQSVIGLRLVRKYNSILKEAGFETDKIFSEKIFKHPFRVIDKTRSIHINGEHVVCKSNFIPEIVNAFKKRKNLSHGAGTYNADDKSWAFALNENNIEFLCDIVKGKNFKIENPIQECYDNIKQIKKQALDFNKFYPHLDIQDEKYYIRNPVIDITIDQTDNVRQAMFNARRYGITIFSDNVINRIDNKTNLDRALYETSGNTWVTSKLDKQRTLDIIKSTKTTVIMVSSYQSTDLLAWMKLLDEHKLDTCVAFRYKKDTDANKKIKQYNMNSYNPNCNVIIINEKIPKTFLQDNIQPDLILVDLQSPPTHYKTQMWLDNKPLIVYTNTVRTIKDKKHGIL